jgi:hypothetical protein
MSEHEVWPLGPSRVTRLEDILRQLIDWYDEGFLVVRDDATVAEVVEIDTLFGEATDLLSVDYEDIINEEDD